MSSQQKRGFRLPWAGENGPDEGGDAAVSEATELEPVAEVVSGSETDMETQTEQDEVNEGDARLAALMASDETTDAAPAASTVPQTAAEAEMMDTESATSQSEDEVASEDAEPGNPWPSSARPEVAGVVPDARSASRPFMQVQRGSKVPTRDNPLVAGLVKAMREAALASRAETTSRLQGEATARVEAIRSEATTDAAALRKRVDDDIASIREWSKIEMARIRAETEGRIETRRAEAIAENKEHLDGVERLVDAVQSTVASFEADMDQFFKQLLAETDPARLATLAAQAPEPPDFSAVQTTSVAADEDASSDDDADAADETQDVLEPDAAAEAEAEATEGLDMSSPDAWTTGLIGEASNDIASEAGDETPSEAGDETTSEAGDDTPSEAGEDSATDAAAKPKPGNSQLFVNGLTSVADISAFKGAVGQLDGVRSVSVSSGERGMFIFNVGHDPDADLASAVASLSGFAVEIMEASGDSLTVTAHESAA
jgi:hypothetical protein